jgi:hypothetical protein
MTAAELLDDMSCRNRAYNLLYALGKATPDTVQTFSPGEAAKLIQAAKDVAAGNITTEQHRAIATLLSPSLLHYITTGGIGKAAP